MTMLKKEHLGGHTYAQCVTEGRNYNFSLNGSIESFGCIVLLSYIVF